MYNYAGDNTISCIANTFGELKGLLETDTMSAIQWFNFNQMKVNPDNLK